jgi:hypothetical protein
MNAQPSQDYGANPVVVADLRRDFNDGFFPETVPEELSNQFKILEENVKFSVYLKAILEGVKLFYKNYYLLFVFIIVSFE